MTIEEILAGESKNVEFKVQRPKDSVKYMKTIVAFSNGEGGRIVFGVDDVTREVVGIPKDIVFQKLTPLHRQFLIAVSRLSFQMFICRPSMIKPLSLQRSARENSGPIISSLWESRMVPISESLVHLVLPGVI